MGDEEKIQMILDWADTQKSFDTTFVEELSDKLGEWGELTDGQSAALDNIIEKWHIE